MQLNDVILKFKMDNQPKARKTSVLEKYKNEILNLRSDGYSQTQIIAVLSKLNIKVTQPNLSQWLKRQNPKLAKAQNSVSPSSEQKKTVEVVEKKIEVIEKPAVSENVEKSENTEKPKWPPVQEEKKEEPKKSGYVLPTRRHPKRRENESDEDWKYREVMAAAGLLPADDYE